MLTIKWQHAVTYPHVIHDHLLYLIAESRLCLTAALLRSPRNQAPKMTLGKHLQMIVCLVRSETLFYKGQCLHKDKWTKTC